MLTSRTVPRSRPLQAHTVVNNVFGSSNTSLLRSRHRLQIRAFRFGMWSSYLDPAYHRELRRRHRTLKHKYADAINRRLSWHGHPLAEEPSLALKRVVARYWTPAAARCSSRWVNQDELDSRKARSYRPSHATFSFDAKPPQPDSWRSHIDQLFNSRFRQTSSDVKPPKGMEMNPEPSHMNGNIKTSKSQKKNRRERVSTVEEDYVIDPITNRKVPKRDHESVEKDLEPQTPTFKTYRSQFTPFVPPELEQETPPIHSQGNPPAAELSKYAKSQFEDWPAVRIHSPAEFTESPVHPEAAPYVFDNSALKNEEYALNHLPPDDPIEEYDDLHKYRPRVSDETLEKSSDIHDNSDVVDTVEPSRISHFDPSCQSVSNPDQLQIELQSYGPYIYNESLPEHISPEEPKDLEKYRYHVSEGPELPAKPSTVYDDLHKYRPTSFEEIKDHDQPFEQYGDLEKYEAFRHQGLETMAALERDITAESLKEYEAKEQDGRVPDVIDTYIQDGLGKLPKMKLPEGHIFSKHYSGETGAGATHSSRDNGGDREQLHQHMKKLSETSDAVDREINSNLRKSRQEFTNDQSVNPQRNLTGNFVQDFPEEFQQIWNVHEGGLMPRGNQTTALESPHDQEMQSRIQNAEKKYSENLSSSTNKAVLQPALDRLRISSRLEPALKRRASAIKGDRLNRAFRADLHSKEPQGLETSFSEECGGRHTMPLYTRTYGSEPGQVAARSKPTKENEIPETPMPSTDFSYHRDPEIDGIPPLESIESPRGQKATHSEEPTVYKILAYDPTMQTINIAETTSVVPDQASPLSPTEVLLRLSNPTKFFPHFAPLQAEGFEIVSGSGDVLVFRQVRPAKAAARGSGPPVNPIDMMGRPTALPSAAAFVSPTGFVNYDIPRVEEELTEPAFRSNIDVRREEPVFSGQKPSASDKKSKKPRMNVGKRVLIGGAWVAGISYALGVVSEYFTTGGVDGKGPTGF